MVAITARIDRVQLISWPGGEPPEIVACILEWDHFVRTQTTTGTYARARKLTSRTSGTTIFWQYRPRAGWLKPWKISLIPNDVTGLSVVEIQQILKHCIHYRILTVELAVDFSLSSGVSGRFVRRHAVFGKSRRRATNNDQLRYGGRKSGKLVRCYKKPEVGVYRVELELHSRLLRDHRIVALADLSRLPDVVCPRHLQFVDLDWNQLRRHLAKSVGDRSDDVITEARRRKASILRVQRYLRRSGVFNTHRFLVPKAMNEDVRLALDKLTRMFR